MQVPREAPPPASWLRLLSFLSPSRLLFFQAVGSLETISSLAVNARDQLGSQESGVSKGQGEEGSLGLG